MELVAAATAPPFDARGSIRDAGEAVLRFAKHGRTLNRSTALAVVAGLDRDRIHAILLDEDAERVSKLQLDRGPGDRQRYEGTTIRHGHLVTAQVFPRSASLSWVPFNAYCRRT